MEKFEQDLEWLIIFLAYNNNYYDLEKKDTIDYYTMEEQTKYIRNQIRNFNYNHKVKVVLVEAQIKNIVDEQTNKTSISSTLSILHKTKGRWLPAVDGIWRQDENADIFTNNTILEKTLLNLKTKFSSKRHIIITVGHGSITGINYYIPELKQKALKPPNGRIEKIFLEESADFVKPEFKTNVFSSIEVEQGKYLLFLSNEEICEVIKTVFKEEKLDVLVMYNCLMQNLFTQYEIKEVVDWLVAPLSGISIPGFNYVAVINEISKNPEKITSEEVARLFLDTIRPNPTKKWPSNNYGDFKADIEGTWKIAALKLDAEQQNAIQEKINALFKDLNSHAVSDNTIISCLYETGRFSFSYSLYCLPNVWIIDVGIFLAYLKDKINREFKTFKSLIPKIEDLENAIHNKQIHIFEGSNFYNKEGEVNYKEHESQFADRIANMSIFFPVVKFESNLLEYIYDESAYNYRNRDTKYRYLVPRLLKDYNYGAVLKRLIELPD